MFELRIMHKLNNISIPKGGLKVIMSKFNSHKIPSNVHKIDGVYHQCSSYHNAKFEYKR